VTSLFVFTADLHLEDGAWSTRPSIYGDAYYSFAQIVDYCIEKRLPLILGGDVLEKKSNSARPIAKLCEGLSRMQQAGVPVYYIQGNHEYDRNAPWLSVHPWPQHIHRQSVEIQGHPVYGLDWLPRGEIQEAFKAVPERTHILITHQVWEDLMKGLGRTECSIADVHNVRTVLAGDFHVTTTVEGINADGLRTEMLSPGSICMQDLGECPTKYFFVINRKEEGGFEFEAQKLRTRPFLNYAVKEQELLDRLCAGELATTIAEAQAQCSNVERVLGIDKPIVRIKFDKRLPDAFLRLTTAVGDSAHLFCEALADKNAVQQSKNNNRDGARNDVLAALSDLLGADSEEYKLAERLVRAEDPGKELEAFFNAFFTEEVPCAIVETGSSELGTPSPAGV
jgi:hypothetical protein